LKRTKRCVDVLARYPGLCNFALGGRGVHCMASALAIAQDGDTYKHLQTIYNSIRSAGTPSIPPMEEWHTSATGLCQNIFCTSMQRFIESKTLDVYSFTSRRHFDSNDTIMPACCRAGGISASSSARIASTCISTVFGVQDEHNERCCGCYTRGGCRGDVQDYDDMALDSKLLTTGTCQLGSLQGGSRSDAAWELERINTNAASKAFAHTFAID
ncbi:unnamed protein product, partial [Sphacelaria rigidula]